MTSRSPLSLQKSEGHATILQRTARTLVQTLQLSLARVYGGVLEDGCCYQ